MTFWGLNKSPAPAPSGAAVPFRQKILLVSAGILVTLILLELGMRLAGFALLSLQEYRNRVSLRGKGTYRILCLGESTTFMGNKDSYPRQLEEILNKRAGGLQFSVINKGVPRIRTSGILADLNKNLDTYKPDMVIARHDHRSVRAVLDSFKTVQLVKSIVRHLASRLSGRVLSRCFLGKDDRQFQKKLRQCLSEWENDPDDIDIRFKLQTLYKDTGHFTRNRHIFDEFIKRHTQDDIAPAMLGSFYYTRKDYDKARKYFQKSLSINPQNQAALSGLGDVYLKRNDTRMAEKIYRKLIAMNPKNKWVYLNLAQIYGDRRELNVLETLMAKCLNEIPDFAEGYACLGKYYYYNGQLDKALALFKKSLEIKPDFLLVRFRLADTYLHQKDYANAEKEIKQILYKKPGHARATGMLALVYQEMGLPEKARENFKKTSKMRQSHYLPVTRRNYRTLRDILQKRGIPLVCVQYPMQDVQSLKNLFDHAEGVVFVDNESLFKKAVASQGYQEYFIDNFAGDFGHCTPEGNRLLAGNVADAILASLSPSAARDEEKQALGTPEKF